MTSTPAPEPSGPIEPEFPEPRPHSLAEDAYGLLSGALLMALGLDEKAAGEVIRVSIGRETSEADIDAFLAVWRELAAQARGRAQAGAGVGAGAGA